MDLISGLLSSVHAAAAAEAMALAAKAGLNTRQVYKIIVSAAGNSTAFEESVPHMLDGNRRLDFDGDADVAAASSSTLNKSMDQSRSMHFPLPIGSAVEQIEIASSHLLQKNGGGGGQGALTRFYLRDCPDLIEESARHLESSLMTPISSPYEISKIAFIGLGAMGQGMAASLLRSGFEVQGYDIYSQAMDRFLQNKGDASAARTASHAMRDADVVLLMVQSAAQAEDILFGSENGVDSLSDGTVVILSSTVPPAFARELDDKLKQLGRGISIVDAPVSGGVARAAKGTLTIISSGDEIALSKVHNVLLAMAGNSDNLWSVHGGVGAASSVKVVNQLLAGVHIAAAAEAMALATRLGLDTRATFNALKLHSSGSWSWMLENRVPQMLEGDWTPHSSLAIFVKDLGIVLDEARRLGFYAPIASAAHSLYLSGASHGWTNDSDAGVVRLWELLTGVSVASMAGAGPCEEDIMATDSDELPQSLPAAATISALAPEFPGDILGSIQTIVNNRQVPTLVVLDDDPTGTQTCNEINVLTVWDVDSLRREFELNSTGFFILTNSRALPSAEARQLMLEVCHNVKTAAAACEKSFEIVLRGDSTLRGHLPEEPEAAEEALGCFSAWVIAPFFAQGGRFTINDIHYVKEGDILVPASQTPFAQDATFGYKNSNLRQYIMEKCGPRFNNSSFISITLDDIRLGGPSKVTEKLLALSSVPSVPSVPSFPSFPSFPSSSSSTAPTRADQVIIVNAVNESDMHVFVAGLLEAEKTGRRYLYRTGAAFVSSRLGIRAIPPLTLQDMDKRGASIALNHGGLIIAGSYVPKTTEQLRVLRERRAGNLYSVVLDVSSIVSSPETAVLAVEAAAKEASQHISSGKDVLVMTSRRLIKGEDATASLSIGSKVAAVLVQVLGKIQVRPRYIIAKGGITSSDAATKGLGMKRARVLGQAAPGVPLWKCDEETSRHRGVPYVVFPGNVGSEDTLADIVESWALSS